MPFLEIRGLSKSFEIPGGAPVQALSSIDLDVARGEFVVIVGHNGSGKSTLLSILGGELNEWEGTVSVGGSPLDQDAGRASLLKQDPAKNVALDLTVEENLYLADIARGLEARRPSIIRSFRKREKPLGRLRGGVDGLSDLGQLVRTLSGGQRQLLAIQLAMAQDPDVVLLDEPTASLDQSNAGKVIDVLEETWKSGMTVLLVTHDLATARQLGSRLVVMRDGRVVADYVGEDRAALTLEALYDRCGFGIIQEGTEQPFDAAQ